MTDKEIASESLSNASAKKRKGILLWVPLFLLLCGSLIILYSGWNLFKQTYLIGKLFFQKPATTFTEKKFVINNISVKNPAYGSEIGNIEIPSININYPIINGLDDDVLSKGVEHDSRTPMPGQNSNPVLAGHRDTVFTKLGDVKIGDTIKLKLYYGTFTYKASQIRIVNGDDDTVIVSSNKEMLTLYTCYPFNYIGQAPKRYVVTCDFVSSDMKQQLQVENKK